MYRVHIYEHWSEPALKLASPAVWMSFNSIVSFIEWVSLRCRWWKSKHHISYFPLHSRFFHLALKVETISVLFTAILAQNLALGKCSMSDFEWMKYSVYHKEAEECHSQENLEEARKDSHLGPPEGMQPCPHFDVILWAPELWPIKFCCFKSPNIGDFITTALGNQCNSKSPKLPDKLGIPWFSCNSWYTPQLYVGGWRGRKGAGYKHYFQEGEAVKVVRNYCQPFKKPNRSHTFSYTHSISSYLSLG